MPVSFISSKPYLGLPGSSRKTLSTVAIFGVMPRSLMQSLYAVYMYMSST
jgi:hypothetical protein